MLHFGQVAAHVAVTLSATELVLLKSTLPLLEDVHAAAQVGYVDRYFPLAASSLRIRCVNLRDESFPEQRLRPS